MTGHRPVERVAVIGAGLTGCLLAARLADFGVAVDLFERRPDPRDGEPYEGRSINLALSTRGLDALDRLGIGDELRSNAVPVRGRMIHHERGDTSFQPYSTNPSNHLWSVNRDRLNLVVLEAALRRPEVAVHFEHRLDDLGLPSNPDQPIELTLTVEESKPIARQLRVDAVFGTDGAYSAVRARMQRLRNYDYAQDHLEHGYKELHIPAVTSGDRLRVDALHIWPRGDHMMIALANPDGSFTCTLFWPYLGHIGFESIDTAEEVERVFATVFADAVPHMPTLVADYLANPVGSLVTVHCEPWNHHRVVILGDAAHAVVPFYGQGANAALEDVTILCEEIDASPDDWNGALARFASTRRPDTDALAQLALDNFVEMRDHVGSRWFLAVKTAERWLHRWWPDRVVPLYEMVTFSRLPYSQAVERSERQDRLLARIVLVAAAAVALVVIALAVAILG